MNPQMLRNMKILARSSAAGLNLPLGYKFNPTSVILLQHFLIPKLRGEELPHGYVIDLENPYSCAPRHLPFSQSKHTTKDMVFCFTTDVRKNSAEEKQICATSDGFWQVYKENLAVEINGEVIGFETKFRFHDVHGNKTDWKMSEYRCHPAQIPSNAKSYIVLCKIKLKANAEAELMREVYGED